MKKITTTAFLSLVLLCAHSAAAQDRGSATFVTGFSMANGSPLTSALTSLSGGVNNRINLGGRVTFHLAPGFDAVGEVGRIANVLPPLTTAALSFSPVDIRASAFYTEGGVRTFLGRSAVSPYVEATGGIARVSLRVGGINATTDELLQLGLGFTSRTSPTAGLGAGVMWQAGRITFDTGYRYKKIFSQSLVDRLLAGGQELTSHQVVFGVGVRF
jgi:opacity protein-like surface antigen